MTGAAGIDRCFNDQDWPPRSCSLWAAISPWMFGLQANVSATWTYVIVGCVVMTLAATQLGCSIDGRLESRPSGRCKSPRGIARREKTMVPARNSHGSPASDLGEEAPRRTLWKRP